jgi:putative DNA primase/helicase
MRLDKAVDPLIDEQRRNGHRPSGSDAAGSHGSEHGGAAEGGTPPPIVPDIDAGEQDLRVITPQAWGVVQTANARESRLFRHGGGLARVELDDAQRPVLRELTAPRLRHELAQLAHFYVIRGKHERDTYPPAHLIEDMLATPDPPLPVVTRVSECPTFAPNGTLQTTLGYHAASQTYYAPPAGLHIPPVPAVPNNSDVAEAKRLLLDELAADFPFVSPADRTHAIGLGLLPSARDLIDGPTPLHIVEAPIPGSGKGLCVEAVLRPACGRSIGAIAQARDDDEMRKRITAMLRDGHPAIQIDNVTSALDSAALSMALTIPYWTDRVLGQTATVRFPVRCVWVATANNPVMSTEIARRSIRVRLDPKRDRPWERDGWRHPELLSWADAHRGRLVWANLILIQAWLAAGRPRFTGRVLGSYEHWAHVVGGILQHAGIPGFLDNLVEFYEQADVETAVWRAFVAAWWDAHGTNEVGTAELFPIARDLDGMELDGATEKAQRTAFGKALGRQRDRVVGEYRIGKTREVNRAARWRLFPVDGSGVLL